jgi:hypothetical protein
MIEATQPGANFGIENMFEQRDWTGKVQAQLLLVSGVIPWVNDVGVSKGTKQRTADDERRILLQAVSLLRLKPGDEVVAWTGARMVAGQFLERRIDSFMVMLDRAGGNVEVPWALPLDVAVHYGIWPWVKNMHVAADVNGDWREAIWLCAQHGKHLVRDAQGRHYWVDDVTFIGDAIKRGLLRPTGR